MSGGVAAVGVSSRHGRQGLCGEGQRVLRLRLHPQQRGLRPGVAARG